MKNSLNNDIKNTIYIVGMGPGEEKQMTKEALVVLQEAEVIVGYKVYLDLLGEKFQEKEFLSTPMKQEVRRCEMCFEEAEKGKKVAMICSGDAGVYGMASLMYELSVNYSKNIELYVVPGITAAVSGAADLGAPVNHDFCVISLSDLLTPKEVIRKRLKAAAYGDFVTVLYNPSSKKRKDYLKKACEIMGEYVEGTRACGYVRNIGREGNSITTCTFEELKDHQVDMFTTVFIGNSTTKIINGKLVTPRGYKTNE
ncbi:precorrin-3B C17-methyltransferase [Lachnospiraceae bacterium C7]|nr:precorrin-3B C17-methyltransferase [Lachnospiraceae bacterium C7]